MSYSKLNYSSSLSELRISIGYTVFRPNADTIYYQDSGGAPGNIFGKATFSEFKMLLLSINYFWDISLGKRVKINPGLGIAANYGFRDTYVKDSYGEFSNSEKDGWVGLVPKVELEYKINERLNASPFFSFSFLLQTGSSNPDSKYYNEHAGSFISYLTTGFSLGYSF